MRTPCSLPNSIRINIFINCADFSILNHEPHRHICCQHLHHQQNHLLQQCELRLLYHERHHYISGKKQQHQQNHHQLCRLLHHTPWTSSSYMLSTSTASTKPSSSTMQTSQISRILPLYNWWKTTTAKTSLSRVQTSPSYIMNLTSKTIFINSANFSVQRHELDCYISDKNNNSKTIFINSANFAVLHHELDRYTYGKNNNSIRETIFINCGNFSVLHLKLHYHIPGQNLQHQQSHLHHTMRTCTIRKLVAQSKIGLPNQKKNTGT